MKSLKISLAVLIVALGQGNVFLHNRSFSSHGLQDFAEKSQRKFFQFQSEKQKFSRLPRQKQLNLKVILQARENKTAQGNQNNNSIILVASNLVENLRNNRQFDFRQIKEIWPIWFGCCKTQTIF